MTEAVNWAITYIHKIHITSIKRMTDQREFASDFAFFKRLHFRCVSRQFLHCFFASPPQSHLAKGKKRFTCRVSISVGVWDQANFAFVVACIFALAFVCFAVYMANNSKK